MKILDRIPRKPPPVQLPSAREALGSTGESAMTDAEIIQQLTMRLRETIDENDKLRALVANLTEGANAHTVLQSFYRDPSLPESLRAKCAIGALPHETPRLESVPPPLDLVAEEYEPLSTVVERQRARMNRLLSLSLEERSALITGVARDDGNGSDSDQS